MNCPKKNKNKSERPRTAKPATPRPMTVPPPKDTLSACGKLVLAASAVRALASVAIRIPIFPAAAEKNAPKIKAGTIIQLVVSTKREILYKAMEAIATKIRSKRYSAFKNASAPSLILFEMDCIFSSPGLCFLTHTALAYIKIRPKKAKAIGR